MKFKFWRTSIAISGAILASLAAWAQFVPDMTQEALEKEIATQVANNVALAAVLAAAQTVGVTAEKFTEAATNAGVPVASITTTVLGAAFVPNMTPEALQKEIETQIAKGVTIEAVLAAAQNAGVNLESFVTAAYKAGLPVANITTAVLQAAEDRAVALKTLGQALVADLSAIETVFKTALTLPIVTIDPVTVAAFIENGCESDCLPAAVVTAAVAGNTSGTTQPPPADTSSTTTSTESGGGGSGGGGPLSPA